MVSGSRKSHVVASLLALLMIGGAAMAQTQQDIPALNAFMNAQPEIAVQLRGDPRRLNSPKYQGDHPALAGFLRKNPGIREIGAFNIFAMEQPQVLAQLYAQPSRMNDASYIQSHPAYAGYLRDHPEMQQAARRDPNGFLVVLSEYRRILSQAVITPGP